MSYPFLIVAKVGRTPVRLGRKARTSPKATGCVERGKEMDKTAAAKLAARVGELPAWQLRLVEEVSDLTPDEAAAIREALELFPVEIRDLADQLLENWPTISVPERTAALLALAAGLARIVE